MCSQTNNPQRETKRRREKPQFQRTSRAAVSSRAAPNRAQQRRDETYEAELN